MVFRSKARDISARALAVGMAFTAVVQLRASAAPADILASAAPAPSPAQTKATPLNVGDASVSTQTGAFEYSYPIHVPPGRQGMQPALALAYSSQASVYGTVAAGWSIPIPIITLDTSNGRLASGKTYVSSMGGGRPLVPETEPRPSGYDGAYRAQNDSTFTRYFHGFRQVPQWIAQTTSGITYRFGENDFHNKGCAAFTEDYAPLTTMVDSFGNAVDYLYTPGVVGECLISQISWGNNGTTIQQFARVDFAYATTPLPACNGVPLGSQTSYRTGTKMVMGASQLDTLNITAFTPGNPAAVVHTRRIKLAYSGQSGTGLPYGGSDADCAGGHAAFRSLVSIQESAWGTDSPQVDLPAVKFTYGNSTLPYPNPDLAASLEAVPWHDTWGGLGVYSALSWGQRFTGPGKWGPTIEAMLIDVDGDGLLDRVTNDSSDLGTNHVTRCGATWERNQGPGQPFASAAHIDMPTLKWTSSTLGDYSGGGWANQYSTNEGCSLNYQQTSYINSHSTPPQIGCPTTFTSCPAGGYCTSTQGYGNDCGDKAGANPTILAYRWFDFDGDGKVDLVASIAQGGLGVYNVQYGNGAPGHAPVAETTFGTFPLCPGASYNDGSATSSSYTMCNGMYPYFVYRNKGGGVFGTHSGSNLLPDSIVYEPIPLETTAGDSSITGPPIGETTGTLDLDGDGRADGVKSGTSTWTAFRGDGNGTMRPASTFGAGPADGNIAKTDTVVFGVSDPMSTAGLFDLNGDGLPDHWKWTTSPISPTANLEYNDGKNFIQTPVTIPRPANDGIELLTSCTSTDCTRIDSSRTLDVDGDGRMDLVQFPGRCSSGSGVRVCITTADCAGSGTCIGGSTVPNVFFNEGGAFAAAATSGWLTTAFNHAMQASSTLSPTQNIWAVHNDMIDLDGDGIAEGVEDRSLSTGFWRVSRIPIPTQPPRLLASIDNGRGATTTVNYAPMSSGKQLTGAVVTQDWPQGKVNPSNQWVVSSLSVRDNVDAPATVATTTISYKNPVYSQELDPALGTVGHFGFRGFEEATTTSPTLAKTVDRYDYSVDWRGAHKQTLVYPAETQSNPTTIDTTTIESRTLFSGTVRTYHATVADHLICAPGQTETTCTPTTAAGFSRTSSTLNACGDTSTGGTCDSSTVATASSLLWVATQTLLQAGTAAADGDRRTRSTFAVYAPATTMNYRVRPLATTQEWQVGGVFAMYGKKASTWDTSFLFPVTDEVWVDANDSNRSITRYEHDPVTGNRTARWKPIQNASGGPELRYTYDSRQLFVVTDLSEPAGYYNLRQEVDYVYEYGTGTKLETKGPNVASCGGPPPYTSPTCPPNTVFMQDARIRIDGIGRVLNRWETMGGADASAYYNFERERNTYVDGNPSSVTSQHAFDYVEATLAVRFDQSKVDLDGHGRPLRQTAFALGTVPNDAITTYTYNDQGQLKTIVSPDPSQNSTATVATTYVADSLGRPVSMRRPDTPASQSGVDLSYSGLTATSHRIVGTAGGQESETTSTTDVFGRLVRVDEKTSSTTTATTTYGYDPGDTVNQIVDPMSVTTTMKHDYTGHRTEITRGGRTWKFTYDKNGNLSTELFPGSTLATITDYTNSTVYDNLDRPISRLIGQRALTTTDQANFGAGGESLLWDLGANEIGQLSIVYSYSPGATPATATTTTQYGHDLQGRTEKTIETYAGMPGKTQTFLQHHTLGGGPSDTYYNDYPAPSRATYSRVIYDDRGLPSLIQLTLSTATPTLNIAQQTRNVSGLVTKRRTDVTTGTMGYVESNWVYDTLGRVTSQVVQKGPGTTQVVRQDLVYFGDDNVKSLDHYLGASNHKHFNYGYDLRDQITTVGETLLPNAFTATYGYNAAGRFASANEAAPLLPGSDVQPRNVNYQYAGTDPEEVTSLTNVSGGATAWSFTYDAAGNEIMRCSGPIVSGVCNTVEMDYTYDGNDRLRRVVNKSAGDIVASEEYWYDGSGARNIVTRKDKFGIKGETLWFVNDLEAHYDLHDNWAHSYAYVSLGTPVARVDTGSSLVGTVEYNFNGLANNTIAAVDQNTGTINASFNYAPFGEVVEATNGGGSSAGIDAHARRMNDKFTDLVSGLQYQGYRYYDKVAINWTQPDPLYAFVPDAAQQGTPRRASLYAFSLNNPLRYIDPDGQDAQMQIPEDSFTANLAVEAANQATETSTNHETDSQKKHRYSVMGRHHAEDDIAAGVDRARYNQLKASRRARYASVRYLHAEFAPDFGDLHYVSSADPVSSQAYIEWNSSIGDRYSDARQPYLVLEGVLAIGLAGEVLSFAFAAEAAVATDELYTSFGRMTIGGGEQKVIQTGGRTILKQTAKALNDYHETDLAPREWGLLLEELKDQLSLPNDHHGKITLNGDYLSPEGAWLGSFLP